MSFEGKVEFFYGSLKFIDLFFLLNEVMEKTFDPSEAVA